MRIERLATVCGFLLTTTIEQSEQLAGFLGADFDDGTSGSELLPLIHHLKHRAKVRSSRQLDSSEGRRVFVEGPVAIDSQGFTYQGVEGKKWERRSGHLGGPGDTNEVAGEEELPVSAEVIEENAVHIEPVNRTTKKSIIESILDLIRRMLNPAKSELGPLIGPLSFPGMGEKIYIRLPEPVEYESNHVVVHLISLPSSVEHSPLPVSGDASAAPTSHQPSPHYFPPRNARPLASPPVKEPQDHEGFADELDVSASKHSTSLRASSPRNFAAHKNDSRSIANSAARANRQNANSRAAVSSGEQFDETSRMSRASEIRFVPSSSFRRTIRGHGDRLAIRINPSRESFRSFRKPFPERNAKFSSYSRRGVGRGGNPFSGATEARKSPRYSLPETKSQANEWRGIVGPWRNVKNTNSSSPSDGPRFRGPLGTLQQLLKRDKTNFHEFSNRAALRVIDAPNLRPSLQIYDKTNNLREGNWSEDASKNATSFDESINQRSTLQKLENPYENGDSKKSSAGMDFSEDFSQGSSENDRSKPKPRFERLKGALKFDEAENLARIEIPDSHETRDTEEKSRKTKARRSKPSGAKVYALEFESVGSREDIESQEASERDILSSVMSMTASQSWEQKNAPKTKSILGVLKRGKNEIDERIQAPRNRREEYEDYENSSQHPTVDYQNHKCVDSQDENYDCEFQGQSTSENWSEFYEKQSGAIGQQLLP